MPLLVFCQPSLARLNLSQGISSRVRRELKETEERLEKQKQALLKLQLEVQKFAEKTTAEEASKEDSLAVLTSDAAAARLRHDLSKQHLNLLTSEQARLMEQIGESTLLQDKHNRVSSTKAQLEDIKERIQQDEKTIAAHKVREAEIMEEAKACEAAAATRQRHLEIER